MERCGHQRRVWAVGAHRVVDRGAQILARGPRVDLPPRRQHLLELAGDLGEPGAQELPLVGEVDVEGGARDPDLGHELLDADLGEALALADQPLDGIEELPPQLVAALRAGVLGLARDGRHVRAL